MKNEIARMCQQGILTKEQVYNYVKSKIITEEDYHDIIMDDISDEIKEILEADETESSL